MFTRAMSVVPTAAAAVVTAVAYTVVKKDAVVHASSDAVHPAAYPWPHDGFFGAYDHAAIRRGYEVYKQICSSCHSLDRIAFRNLVGVSHTTAEAKAIAEEVEVEDGPDDNGDMFKRPGKLSDYFQAPYANENQARAANNGAYPVDLSLVTKARHGGENYIFALLTGYKDAPAGVEIRSGLYYNPYFAGGAIAMPQQLYDGMVEYADGTPSTASQMAKDVTTFLAWAAEPNLEDRKLMGIRAIGLLGIAAGVSLYLKRYKWAYIKTRKVIYNPTL